VLDHWPTLNSQICVGLLNLTPASRRHGIGDRSAGRGITKPSLRADDMYIAEEERKDYKGGTRRGGEMRDVGNGCGW
jgi:hypothetical protein